MDVIRLVYFMMEKFPEYFKVIDKLNSLVKKSCKHQSVSVVSFFTIDFIQSFQRIPKFGLKTT